jgi:quinol monooxygenase YgiN
MRSVYSCLALLIASILSHSFHLRLMTSVSALAAERPFALNVKVHVKPERWEAFLAVIQQDAAQTVATEAGAWQFTLGEDTSTPHVFYFHEQYRDKAGFEAHTKTPG